MLLWVMLKHWICLGSSIHLARKMHLDNVKGKDKDITEDSTISKVN